MKKPANKAAWVSAAKAVGAELAPKMTVKEITRSIGDKLGVEPRGAGYEGRVVDAIAIELEIEQPEERKVVVIPPSNGAMVKNEKPKVKETPKDLKKVDCKILVHNRKGSMFIDTGSKQVWIQISKLMDMGDSYILIPAWLADMKGI